MEFKYPEIGVCGLSCYLCPAHVIKTKSRCPGCKTKWRSGGPCSLLHCAIKKNIEFCGDCSENKTCEKWKKHRLSGKSCDSFKCYQKLETDINFIQKYGLREFKKSQEIRAKLLQKMLNNFNEGRSKSYYCIVATVLEINEIEESLKQAENKSVGLEIKDRAKLLHSLFDNIALQKSYCLKLRTKIGD